MTARRIEPRTRCARYGLNELPSGRIVFVTHSGLEIGRLPPQQHRRELSSSEEIVQRLLAGTRPLWATQRLVTALCVGERRP